MADAPHVLDIEITTFEAQTPHPMVSTEVALAQSPVCRMASSIRWADAFVRSFTSATVISVLNSYVFDSLTLFHFDHFEVPLVETGNVEEAGAVSEAGRLRRSRAIVDGDGDVPRDERGKSRH